MEIQRDILDDIREEFEDFPASETKSKRYIIMEDDRNAIQETE